MASFYRTPLPFKMQHEEDPVPGRLLNWVRVCPDVWLKNVLGVPMKVL